MSESRFTIRLCDEIATEQQLISYLHSLPKSRRAEHLRLLLIAGYSAIVSNSNPLPAPASTPAAAPVNQPLAPIHKGGAVHTDVTTPVAPSSNPTTVHEVDQTPDTSSLDHREEEASQPYTSTESDSMDAADPLVKMKAKLGG